MNKEKKLALSGAEEMIPELRFPEFENDGEWEERNLGKVGEFVGGGTPSTSKPEYWDGNIQWYTPTEVKNGTLNPSTRTITEEGLKNSSAKLLPQGTILITTRATIGDAAITNYECTTNQGFQSLIVKKTEINLFWYYWILQHKIELERRSSGSTFKEIGKNEIKIIPTLSPKNPDEQQKIADCLSSLDDLIEVHNQKLDALKNHKKGLMQNLFPHPSAGSGGEKVPKLRFPEFKNDGEWVEKQLVDISEKIQDGTHFSPKAYDQGEFLYITSKNVKNGYIDLTNVQYVTAEDHVKIYKRCDVKKGDVLLTKDGTIGQACVNEFPEAFSLLSSVAFIRVNNNNSNYFLYHLLVSSIGQNEISSQIAGQALRRITLTKIKAFSFLFPAKTEQDKIATCLSVLDNSIMAESEKIEQLQEHKKGLMQGLFPKNDK